MLCVLAVTFHLRARVQRTFFIWLQSTKRILSVPVIDFACADPLFVALSWKVLLMICVCVNYRFCAMPFEVVLQVVVSPRASLVCCAGHHSAHQATVLNDSAPWFWVYAIGSFSVLSTTACIWILTLQDPLHRKKATTVIGFLGAASFFFLQAKSLSWFTALSVNWKARGHCMQLVSIWLCNNKKIIVNQFIHSFKLQVLYMNLWRGHCKCTWIGKN